MSSPLHIQTHTRSPLRILPNIQEITDILSSLYTSDTTIRGDHLLTAVLSRLHGHVAYRILLRRLLGVENDHHIDRGLHLATGTYVKSDAVPVVLLEHEHLMSQPIADAFVSLLQDTEREVIDFLFLLYAAFQDISPYYKNYLTRRKISVKKLRQSLKDLVYHDMVLRV